MIVWQMLAALGMGAVLGAGGVSWWVRWTAPRPPALRAKPRRMSRRAYRRLVKAYGAKRRGLPTVLEDPPLRFVDDYEPESDMPPGQLLNHLPPVEYGSSADGRVRHTYVRGPVRGRDHDPT